jgi:hypothetical protein
MPSELESPRTPSLGAEFHPVATRLLPVVLNETEAERPRVRSTSFEK